MLGFAPISDYAISDLPVDAVPFLILPVAWTGPVVTPPPPVPTVTSVSITPATIMMAGGATQAFTSAVTGTNNPSTSVVWASTSGTISQGGTFVAPEAGKFIQTVTISATSVADPTKIGYATVTVQAKNKPVKKLRAFFRNMFF